MTENALWNAPFAVAPQVWNGRLSHRVVKSITVFRYQMA
jgi:hypothetical protein